MPAKGQKRKQQIIDTAKEMFIQNGFQSTHIGQVCERLNIARGTVYQYFGNKREILYAILEAAEEKISDILDQDDLKDFLKTNPSPKSVQKFINERITGSTNVILSEPIIIRLIFKEIVGIDEEVITKVNRFIDNIMKIVVREVEEIKRKGVYKKTINTEVTSMMLIGGVLFIVYEFDRKQKSAIEKDVIEGIVSNYLTGILK